MSDYKPTELDIFKAEYYAEKLKRPDPWLDVEYKKGTTWIPMSGQIMAWTENIKYRWKKPTINVNGIEVPAPVLNPDDETHYWHLLISRSKAKDIRLKGCVFSDIEDAKKFLDAALEPAYEYTYKNKS